MIFIPTALSVAQITKWPFGLVEESNNIIFVHHVNILHFNDLICMSLNVVQVDENHGGSKYPVE